MLDISLALKGRVVLVDLEQQSNQIKSNDPHGPMREGNTDCFVTKFDGLNHCIGKLLAYSFYRRSCCYDHENSGAGTPMF